MGIADNAFFENKQILQVFLSDSVETIGDHAFYRCESLKNIGFGEGLKTIGFGAFSCTGLTEIRLPDGVRTIGNGSFSFCEDLKTVHFGAGLESIGSEAFAFCAKLPEIVIPASVTDFHGSIFWKCSALKKVTFEPGFRQTYLPQFLFYECTSLTDIDFRGNSVLKEIDTGAFQGCAALKKMILPDSVEKLAYGVFLDCVSLENIELPSSLREIASHAFANCLSLTSVAIPKATTYVNHNAFTGSQNLRTLTVEVGNPVYHAQGNCIIEVATKTLTHGCAGSVLPQDDSVTKIGSWAFGEYMNLKEIKISEFIVEIELMSFFNCGGLEKIEVDTANPIFHGDGNCLIRTADKTLLRGCAGSVIPSDGSVLSIQDGAFTRCGIRDIYIPACIEWIGPGVFSGCDDVETIVVESGNENYYSENDCLIEKKSKTLMLGGRNGTVPEGVEKIFHSAFKDRDIEIAVIPESVNTIGLWAFEGCRNLTRIDFAGTVEQWTAISKEESWDRDTGDYVVYCTNGSVSKQ